MMENKKMRAEHPKRELAVDILYDIIGSILFGAGIYTFAEGGNFAPGGISGIALIMNKLWNLPVGTMTLILNIPLVIISYKTVGKRFLIKTARTMIISTIFVDLVFPMFPYYTGQRLLAAIYSGALLGLGMVLFYMRGSSSGGADFLTMTIKKKRPHMSLGRLTLLIDLIIILIGWPVFGDVDSVLYGLIAVFVCSMVIDKILYGIGAGTLAIMAGGDQEDFDAMKEYFETRPVYLELKNKYFGREKFKEEHKKELSGYYRSERILKENLDPSGKIPEGQWKREAARLSEEIAALRKEDKRIHAMLRKYEGIKNHVEALMAEEGEGVSLPETNKREQSTETKEAVRTMKRKKKHHGMEL